MERVVHLDRRIVRREDPYERAIDNLLGTLADPLINAGYHLVMNQDRGKREARIAAYEAPLGAIDAFLRRHAVGDGPFLFEEFGWAEVVFTPFLQRFAFVDYYEGVSMPPKDKYRPGASDAALGLR